MPPPEAMPSKIGSVMWTLLVICSRTSCGCLPVEPVGIANRVSGSSVLSAFTAMTLPCRQVEVVCDIATMGRYWP